MTWWPDALMLFALAGLAIAMRWTVRSGTEFIEADTALAAHPGTLFPATLVRQAGYHPDDLRGVYWATKGLLPLLFVLGVIAFGVTSWPAYAAALAGGIVLPDAGLYWRRRRRQRHIRLAVSYFLDLVVSFLSSGMTLEEAFQRTCAFGLAAGHPLNDEIRLLAVELRAGRPQQFAFDLLSSRTGVTELAHLAAVVGMGKATGAPMIELLKTQAERLRLEQARLQSEMLSRKSIESLFPMLFVSLPMFLVLVFFPTGVQVMQAYRMFRLSW